MEQEPVELELKLMAIEQAAIALLSEAKAAGVDLNELALRARTGVIGDAKYAWVQGNRNKIAAGAAVDYLVKAVKP